MKRPRLKTLRVAAAVVCGALVTAALVDFRGLVPASWAHAVTSIQFVPSAVALGTGAAVSIACIAILLLTLAFGRIYCSVLCPLGVLQDVVSRLRTWVWPRAGRTPPPYAAPVTWMRHLFVWGTIAALAAGWGGLALALLDPYSGYGRIVVGLVRPVVIAANNLLVGPGDALGATWIYRVPVHGVAVGALVAPVVTLLVVAGLAAWRGRLYCNTVCPVGTLLGWVARHAAFRIVMDRSACSKCAACLGACKAQCIDLRRGEIDFSRCVACYDCISECGEVGIGYRFAWGRRRPAAVPDRTRAAAPADPARRAVLRGAAAAVLGVAGLRSPSRAEDGSYPQDGVAADGTVPDGAGLPPPERLSAVLAPPGARSVARFIDRCTACQLCVSACPTGVLQPAVLEYGLAGWLNPRMDFNTSFCNFDCLRCGEVCPTGAIDRLATDDKHLARIGVAVLDLDTCIVKAKGTDCAACSEHCPTKAVETVPYRDNLRLPVVELEYCIGCGACEFACPTRPVRAIRVLGLREHERAQHKVQEKLEATAGAEDFPF